MRIQSVKTACLSIIIGLSVGLAGAGTGTLPDSLIIQLPVAGSADTGTREAVKLSVQGVFTENSPRVGDSLDYVLQAEWEDTQTPVVVLAPDSLDFAGFKVLGQAAIHKKLATERKVRNHTEFIYRLRAETQGTGKATSVKLRYLTGLSRREEAIYVPTALVDIAPAPKRLADMIWFRVLAGLLLLAGAVLLGRLSFLWAARKRKSGAAPTREDFRPAVQALKNRLRAGDSRAVLLDMEGICVRHMQQELKRESQSGTPAQNRFEPLLETYLERAGEANRNAREWESLRDLFRHARFAGGHKEPYELQEAYRILKTALNITGEE
jgi:hypothetical protein